MKANRLPLIGLLALVAFCLPLSSISAQQPSAPQQWEYKAIRIDTSAVSTAGRSPNSRAQSAETALNQLGASGWELVSVHLYGDDLTQPPVFIFKRPKG